MHNSSIASKNKLEEGQQFKISRFKEIIKRTRPHKHEGYFELVYLTEGQGYHWVELASFQIATPEIYLLLPGQLHYWEFTAVPKGYVIQFKETFFSSFQEAETLRLIKSLHNTTRIPLGKEDNLAFILEDMYREYKESPESYSQIIFGYMRVLYSKILKYSQNEACAVTLPVSLCHRFLELLSQKCPQLNKVSEYAALLNTTPQNLNASCRKHAAKSAGELIASQLLLEAKRYILHTDSSVNEIATYLNFNDGSYFIKFFKKYEGVTPVQFRSRYFQ